MKFRNKLNCKNQLIIIIKKKEEWRCNKDMITSGNFKKDTISFHTSLTKEVTSMKK